VCEALTDQILAPTRICLCEVARAEAIFPEITRRKIPHFLVSFDAFMTQAAPFAYRVLPNFKIEAPLFTRFVKSKKARRVFFFTPDLKAYLEQSDKLILPELDRAGIKYRRELFDFGNKDFRPIAAKADAFKPDVVVVSGYAYHVYPALKALREFDLIKKASVIATLDYIDLLHGDFPKTDLADVSFTSPVCEIPGKVLGYQTWRSAFRKKYGKDASYVDAYAYDTARILAAAQAKAGKIDEKAIRSVLPFKGIVGTINLDKDRDLTSTLVVGHLDNKAEIHEVPLGAR